MMLRLVPFLALGTALGFSAAAFLVVNPPAAFRLIRYDESMARIFEANQVKDLDPCAAFADSGAKYAACRKAHLHPSAKPAGPLLKPKYKMADPFWDRA